MSFTPPAQHGAVNEVRRRIIEEISSGHYVKDVPIPSTTRLAKQYAVSTATINRAMYYLQKEGWVERHAGRGTFLGPRACVQLSPPEKTFSSSPNASLRLAVVLLPLDFSSSNWHAQGLLQGIDEAAANFNVRVELIGPCGEDNNRFARRLEQASPDFVAFLKPLWVNAPLIREAERLGIPCLATGTRWRGLGIPTIEENSSEATAIAVRHLIKLGHRRIGLFIPDTSAPLWFDRRHSYEREMEQTFGELDRNLIFWTRPEGGKVDQAGKIDYAKVESYFEKQKPTALFIAGGKDTVLLTQLIQSGSIRIPQNLSLITFDQRYNIYRKIFGDMIPTAIHLPSVEIGKKVVELSLATKVGKALPPRTLVPCPMIEGQSCLPLT